MAYSPLDALQSLRGNQSLSDASNPNGLVQSRIRQQELLDQMKRNRELAQSDPHHFATGATDFDVKDLESSLAEDPGMGLGAQKAVAGLQQADQAAIQAGFRGGMPQEQDASVPRALRPDTPSFTSSPSPSPTQQMAQAGRAAEMAKVTMPLAVEQAKGEDARKAAAEEFGRFMNMKGFGAQGGAAGETGVPAPGTSPFAPSPAHAPTAAPTSPSTPAAPNKSMNWWQILTGEGAPPYSSAKDWMNARAERLKYDAGFPTPFAPLAQETSFANLQQVEAMFPGIRGIQNLLGAFREHQGSWGHETPAATLQRIEGMSGMLKELDSSLDDPSQLVKLSATGHLQLANPPQAIQRAKVLARDTQSKLNSARNILLQQYPGIERSLQQSTGTLDTAPNTSSRFERIE